MLKFHRVLFCAGMDFDNMHIGCLAYKYFVFSFTFHCFVTVFGIVYHLNIGVPQNHPNVHLSEIHISEIDLLEYFVSSRLCVW